MSIKSINPATGLVEREFASHSAEEVEARIAAAHGAYQALADTDFSTRRQWMRRAADLLEADNENVAAAITAEMGKTLVQARAEVAKSAKAMRYYADNAEIMLTGRSLDDPSAVGASQAYVRYQPIGAVLAVMPWNYPIWQVVRFAAPALMAGNTALLKHASNVPQAALYLDALFERAGFPRGAFHSLLISAKDVEAVIRDPRVVAVTLTGSEPAGRSVASIAGSEVKHVVLELGGSDPFIVLPSADLGAAAKAAVTARTTNNGQACINAKRFIVHSDVYDAFADLFITSMTSLRVGDPTDPDTDVGPIATEGGVHELRELVEDAVDNGAKAYVGQAGPEGSGWYYPPTVVSDVTPQMRLYAEEAFGPVATIYRANDLEDALRIANDTTFGLSSAVWTNEPDEERRCIEGLEAGAVFVNGISISYPELPFGGVKDSGVGRELSAEGIREFCNVKSVWKG
jgi:succinate-semialdehyde dehydrogenase/glutarate-semialdehyde dehydrogenase